MGNSNTIGTKIVIDGEKEYRQALQNINAEQKELRSEMKLCVSEFSDQQNSIEALTKKHEILEKQIESQGKKVEIYSKAVEDSSKKQEDAGKRVETLTDELETAQKQMEEMTKSSYVSKDAIAEQQKKIDDLKKELSDANSEYGKAEKATHGWQSSLNDAKTDLNYLNKELDQTDQYLSEAEKASDNCAKSINEYGKNTKDAAEQSQNLNEKGTNAINSLAQVIMAAGVAKKIGDIKEALMDCAKIAAKYETSVAKVSTVADTSAKSMSDINGEILETSSAIGVAASNIADAAYNAISASVDTDKAVEFAGTATRLAIGGFTDATTAVDILTTTLNAYRLEADETVNISDMLVTTQNLGKTTVNELASSLGKVIPVAAAYNINMGNLSSATAILTANGIKTAEAVTYQKAMFNELGDAGSAVGKVLQEQTGKSFGQLMQSGKSLGDVIDILGKSVNNDSAQFNALWSSSEAGIGALSLLGSGAGKFNEVLGKMQKSTGATDEAFKKMTNTSEHAEEAMSTACDNLKIAIGTELNSELKNLYELGADAFNWATEFVTEHPEVVKAVTAVTVAVGIFTAGLIAAKAAQAGLNLVMGLAINPATIIGAAIAGLTGALAIYTLTCEDTKTASMRALEGHQETIQALDTNRIKRKENEDQMAAEISVVTKLKSELLQLNEKETLSNQEKTRMVEVVTQLNKAMPELNIEIDKQTGYLKQSTEETEKLIDANLEYLKVKAAQDSLSEIAEEQLQQDIELTKVEEDLTTARKERAEVEERLAVLKDSFIENESRSSEVLNNVSAELIRAQENVEKYEEQQNLLNESINQTSQDFDSAQKYVNEYNDKLGITGETTEELTDKTVEYHDKSYELAGVNSDVAASIDTVQRAYYDAKLAAEESISSQVGLFDELSIKSDLTTGQMAENLKSQKEAFIQYKDDMLICSQLVEDGIMDEGLLGSLQELGMSGAGYVHELATASKEDLADVIESFKQMEDAKETLSGTLADIKTDYSEQMDGMLGIQTEKQEAYKDAVVTCTGDIQETVKTAGEDIVMATTETMDTVKDTIEETTPDIQEGMTVLCTTMIDAATKELNIIEGKSLKFVDVGKTIPSGIAKGIKDGTAEVAKAITDLINEATAKAIAQVQSASKDIDRAMGSKIR